MLENDKTRNEFIQDCAQLQAEVDRLRAQRDLLAVALDALIADYDGEISSSYGGSNALVSRLSEINYAREALVAYRVSQE